MSDTRSIADIFRRCTATKEFRDAIRSLDGGFSLGPDDIAALGEAYLDRFPGCDGNEECDDVRDAYAVAKICVIEKIIAGTDGSVVDRLRDAFAGVDAIAPVMGDVKGRIGPAAMPVLLGSMERNAERVKADLGALHPCIIKELFSGALAYVGNVLYLMGLHAGIA